MTEKLIVVLKSSPRSKSNSSILADQAAAGASSKGAKVEVFDLAAMQIRPCDACDFCQEGDVGCSVKDDMQQIYPRLREAQGIVIASPVYWFTLSAQAKLCIDRWYALQGNWGNALAGKRFGLVLAYGDTDPYTSGGINAIRTFQDIVRYLHGDPVGIVYTTSLEPGDVLNRGELLEKAYHLGERMAG
jgi:multimeric flavodoxin WrbA